MNKEMSRRSSLVFVGGAAGAAVLSSPGVSRAQGAGVKRRLAGDSDVGEGGRWMKARAQEWAEKTSNRLEYVSRPNSSSQTLSLFDQYWAAQSPDVDAYMIDVIWPGIAAPHAVDLKKYFKEEEISQYFPRIIENNTVDGRLVALPVFTDAGILFYRTDLLQKYGFKSPPETWDDLAKRAQDIQDGERRAGKPDRAGKTNASITFSSCGGCFSALVALRSWKRSVFQGGAYEGLTCDALEWIYSFGGGIIVDRDKVITIKIQRPSRPWRSQGVGWERSPHAVSRPTRRNRPATFFKVATLPSCGIGRMLTLLETHHKAQSLVNLRC